jgi:hypothetical protein
MDHPATYPIPEALDTEIFVNGRNLMCIQRVGVQDIDAVEEDLSVTSASPR